MPRRALVPNPCVYCDAAAVSRPCPCGVCGQWRTMCEANKHFCGSRVAIHRATKEEADQAWNELNPRSSP